MKKCEFTCLWSLVVAFVIGLAPAYAGTAGSLDPTFGKNGVTTTSGLSGINGVVNSILLQGDGKILVFVGGAAVLRYTTSGPLVRCNGVPRYGRQIDVPPTQCCDNCLYHEVRCRPCAFNT